MKNKLVALALLFSVSLAFQACSKLKQQEEAIGSSHSPTELSPSLEETTADNEGDAPSPDDSAQNTPLEIHKLHPKTMAGLALAEKHKKYAEFLQQDTQQLVDKESVAKIWEDVGAGEVDSGKYNGFFQFISRVDPTVRQALNAEPSALSLPTVNAALNKSLKQFLTSPQDNLQKLKDSVSLLKSRTSYIKNRINVAIFTYGYNTILHDSGGFVESCTVNTAYNSGLPLCPEPLRSFLSGLFDQVDEKTAKSIESELGDPLRDLFSSIIFNIGNGQPQELLSFMSFDDSKSIQEPEKNEMKKLSPGLYGAIDPKDVVLLAK